MSSVRSHRAAILGELPAGFTLGTAVPPGGGRAPGKNTGHQYVLTPAGRPLRDGRGMPIKVGCTPREGRSVKNEITRVRRALAVYLAAA